MKNYKWEIIGYEILLLVIIFLALFVPNILARIGLSIILPIYAIILHFIMKKRNSNSIYQHQVVILMIIFALIYIAIFYILGFYFGFLRSKIIFSIQTILKLIIPLTIIIVFSEIIRKYFLSQEIYIGKKRINLSHILAYIISVLVELVICSVIYNLNNLNNLDNFLMALGFVFFASLSCNLLYHYISFRYNSKAVIFFRLITTIYIYLIPITSNIPIFFQSFIRIIYPYIIYIILEKMYSKGDFTYSYQEKKHTLISNTILCISMIFLTMLISCQFYFGIIVIGSRSMTGTINKGDAVIFEKYINQNLQKGQIIIFEKDGVQTVHRIYDIKKVNGEIRYYTKGDANKNNDKGYIIKKDINGVVLLRIKYVGYPTLWFRKLFE